MERATKFIDESASIWRKGPPPFARWNKPRWALLLLLVFAGNVLVATIAWISVRLATQYFLG
jgi:hypothetical protein